MGALPEDASMPYANSSRCALTVILDLPTPTADGVNTEMFASRAKA